MAEEATKYKKISDQIKQVEAGLYFLKIREIENEIKLENEINADAEKEFSLFNEKILDLENSIKKLQDELQPVRDNNLEIISRIQRLNLELQNLDEDTKRMSADIETTKVSLKTIEEDVDREKSIVIDANSNEKRLSEEKNELIETDSKYLETENLSKQDLLDQLKQTPVTCKEVSFRILGFSLATTNMFLSLIFSTLYLRLFLLFKN